MTAEYIRVLPDQDIRRPLWEFITAERPVVISERRRRGFIDLLEPDDVDPEYS